MENTPTPKVSKSISNGISSIEDLDTLIQNVKSAQKEYATYTQEQVNKIFRAAALEANKMRVPLAQQAVNETGMGIMEDKVIKNHFASEYIYNKFKDTKTCGVLEEDNAGGIIKIAEPLGVVAAIVPTTNPTSTAIFKVLLALKTRNGMIISPHPRAAQCTVEAAKIAYEAAVKAGAPKNLIGWIEKPSKELSANLMEHKDIDLILATGGGAMVKAAYSSGNPAIGVGAGNTPAIIDSSADIKQAVASILISKNFDHGVICATEQTIIAVESVYDKVMEELKALGAHLCTPEEAKKLSKVFIIQDEPNQKGHLNADIVGQSAYKIAKMAGFSVNEHAKALVAEAKEVSVNDAFAYEKLSPILGVYKVKDFNAALKCAKDLLDFDGIGHTSSLFVNEKEKEKIAQFSDQIKTGRILINSPSALGAIGDVYNFLLEPSLTLGCGSWGKNSFSGNVTPMNLLNIKTVAKRRENMLWFRVPPKIYHKYGCLPVALGDLEGKQRAVIVTDAVVASLGYLDKVTKVLESIGISYRVYSDVQPDPTLTEVKKGADLMREFNPDVVIALGGGSPMDAAKIMRVLYEYPDTNFEDMSMRFMDIRKRIVRFPQEWKSILVAIPTSSGTGSEVTPFSVITDDEGNKFPLADYSLTPDMAIVDTELVMTMPASLTAASGFDAISHATEALASMLSTPYTDSLAMEALALLFENLPTAYKEPDNIRARENVHNAATIAGMSFANAFLGISHSLAHKIGAAFHIPHGICNAMVLENVVRFNIVDNPRKQGVFPQYEYPQTKAKYAKLASYLGLSGKTDDEKVESFLKKMKEIRDILGIGQSIKDFGKGISEAEFNSKVDKIALDAFDDQCTGANPRYPLVEELKEICTASYYGKAIQI